MPGAARSARGPRSPAASSCSASVASAVLYRASRTWGTPPTNGTTISSRPWSAFQSLVSVLGASSGASAATAAGASSAAGTAAATAPALQTFLQDLIQNVQNAGSVQLAAKGNAVNTSV